VRAYSTASTLSHLWSPETQGFCRFPQVQQWDMGKTPTVRRSQTKTFAPRPDNEKRTSFIMSRDEHQSSGFLCMHNTHNQWLLQTKWHGMVQQKIGQSPNWKLTDQIAGYPRTPSG